MSIENKGKTLMESKEEIEQSEAYKILSKFFDGGIFSQTDTFVKSTNTLAEVITGYGSVNGCPVYAFAQNSSIAGGIMSRAQSEKLKNIYDLALKTGTPIVGFYDSVGAKLTEGINMLAAYGNILNSVANLSGVVPQISVILGTCLGTGALNAVSADFVIMSKKAQLAIETNGECGTYEQVEKDGISHIIAEDTESAIEEAIALISLLPSNNLSLPPLSDSEEPELTDCPIVSVVDKDSFKELMSSYGNAAGIGFAKMEGATVGIVGTKGDTLCSDCCTKIARFVRFCDSFAIPIITFANSDGFSSVTDAAKVAAAYAEATTVKITVITGKAYGAFYIAIAGTGANADITYAWETSIISPLSPITAAPIMWADKFKVDASHRKMLTEKYKQTECTAYKAASEGYVTDIISKEDTRMKLLSALDMLSGKRVTTLPKKHGTI